MQSKNLFANAQAPTLGERFEQLLSVDGLVIERIVSSPRIEQQRYVQTQDEWVVLLHGTAVLEVDGVPLSLGDGDYVFLPASTPHVLREVSNGALWLAVHHHHAEASAA